MTVSSTLAAAVTALGVAAAVTGCTAAPEPYTVPPTETYSLAPLPQGATVVSASPTPPVECGDPTASLRPFPAGQAPDSAALDAIRDRGRLIVGLDTGSNLMSFRNPTTGEIEGFDVDVAREIARDLLGSPDKVEFRVLTYNEREQALEDAKVDIVAKTMAITCERQQRIDFSTVYYDAQQRILVMSGSPISGVADLAGRRVCVGEGTTSLDRLENKQPDAVIVTAPMWSDCLVMLQQNQVDAISTDDTLLLGLATQDPHARLVGPSMGDERYGIGVAEGNDDLVRAVNGTLERIRRDGTWDRIYDRWLSELGPPPGPPPATYRD
ncbi:amino acid ABC transporter substrate-binding protein (PAAT family) [Rhodococcus sp. OK519]|uniref:glutamate ABC transporter substrate-binding protein n=1 Tax=Rhodococcus sp. OK519 TaxID=2135729 RepID=UPI000D3B516A|nr:amino acid ABC transporter substrate-binding protein (PAAT family) [Rhodococcus sp. OK519]